MSGENSELPAIAIESDPENKEVDWAIWGKYLGSDHKKSLDLFLDSLTAEGKVIFEQECGKLNLDLNERYLIAFLYLSAEADRDEMIEFIRRGGQALKEQTNFTLGAHRVSSVVSIFQLMMVNADRNFINNRIYAL